MSAALFAVRPQNSAVLIEARSNVGPIELATAELSGFAEVVLDGGLPSIIAARLQLPVASLTSGRPLYDTEVHRRLDAQRYPTIRAELRTARRGQDNRWALEGDVTIHGTKRDMSGTAEVFVSDEAMRASGQHVIDIRDFGISLPSALMLRIYPDVTVRFRIEALRADTHDQE